MNGPELLTFSILIILAVGIIVVARLIIRRCSGSETHRL